VPTPTEVRPITEHAVQFCGRSVVLPSLADDANVWDPIGDHDKLVFGADLEADVKRSRVRDPRADLGHQPLSFQVGDDAEDFRLLGGGRLI
jgi:hypothetical protein